MTKRYRVTVTVSDFVYHDIEAESEDEAEDMVLSGFELSGIKDATVDARAEELDDDD